MSAEAQKVARQAPSLPEARMVLREGKHNSWVVVLEANTEPDDLLSPGFWAHNAARLTQLDHIQAWSEDMAWYAHLYVLDAGTNWAKVHREAVHTTHAETPERSRVFLPGHIVKWGGPFAKWRVIREVDQHVLKDKFASDSDAYSWLASYAKTVST